MDIIAETLRWVNSERVARGIGEPLEALPAGQWRNCYECPIARALAPNREAEVCSTGIYFSEDDQLATPSYVEEFIDRFDNAEFPDLVGE